MAIKAGIQKSGYTDRLALVKYIFRDTKLIFFYLFYNDNILYRFACANFKENILRFVPYRIGLKIFKHRRPQEFA